MPDTTFKYLPNNDLQGRYEEGSAPVPDWQFNNDPFQAPELPEFGNEYDAAIRAMLKRGPRQQRSYSAGVQSQALVPQYAQVSAPTMGSGQRDSNSNYLYNLRMREAMLAPGSTYATRGMSPQGSIVDVINEQDLSPLAMQAGIRSGVTGRNLANMTTHNPTMNPQDVERWSANTSGGTLGPIGGIAGYDPRRPGGTGQNQG